MIKRTIKNKILDNLNRYPVVVLTGARQTGKTTIVNDICNNGKFKYVSLDDPRYRSIANEDPLMFIQMFDLPLAIDEIQYVPKLFEVIEYIINQKRLDQNINNHNGWFILTGSQSFTSMNNVTHSLAGRTCIFDLEPLSYNELNNLDTSSFIDSLNNNFVIKENKEININELFELIVKGFYPELYKYKNQFNSFKEIDKFYQNYIETYINKGISELINLQHKSKFINFMTLIASYTGQQLNVLEISNAIGVDSKTINHWLSILQTTKIIYFLEPYNDISIKKRLVKTKKIYFADTGLASHLSGLNNAKTLLNSKFAGAYFETFVINEIRKSFLNNNLDAKFYYYRDSNQNEIDLVILYQGKLYLIEIKLGVQFDNKNAKKLNLLDNGNYQIAKKLIICCTNKNYYINNQVECISFKSI